MHSGFDIPGIQQQENPGSGNPAAHFLEQIPTTTQQFFMDQHHHYAAAPAYFPVNFKLGLNNNNTSYDYNIKAGSGCINGGEDAAALVRGSERYEMQQTRQSSLGMLHCWQNQHDSTNKQTPFWEPLPEEVSNENSEIVDKQEMNQRETLTTCLDSKNNRVHFGELEAIYRRLGATTESTTQTRPSHHHVRELPHVMDSPQLPVGSEASIGEEASDTRKERKKKKKKKKNHQRVDQHLVDPTAEFFGKLVKQVVEHQENLQRKFMEVVERLDEERREREEAWRSQETAHFEREAEARAKEKATARSREDMIVSYLEKFTGEKINFPLK